MSSDKRVFVAGASGVIGRVLCRLLVEDGWEVTGTTRRAERARALTALGVQPVIVDVFDAMALRTAVLHARPTAVVHQLTDLPQRWDSAAREEVLASNALVREVGSQHLVDAAVAAGVATMVAQSIAFVYAPGPQPFREEDPLDVDAADPVTRRTVRAVRLLEHLVLGAPFRGVVLRYGQLYGPGTWASEPPAGAPLHVHAAADAARRALVRGEAGIYNVAEPDGAVTVDKAMRALGWSPAFRVRDGGEDNAAVELPTSG